MRRVMRRSILDMLIEEWDDEGCLTKDITTAFAKFGVVSLLFAILFLLFHMLYSVELWLMSVDNSTISKIGLSPKELVSGIEAADKLAMGFGSLSAVCLGIAIGIATVYVKYHEFKRKRRVRRVRERMMRFYEDYMRRVEQYRVLENIEIGSVMVEIPEFKLDVELPKEEKPKT